MVPLQKLSLVSLVLTLAAAKNLPSMENGRNIVQDVRMRMGVRTDGITTEEEVELNYEQNYVRVITPGRSGTSPVVMIHDYNLNQTLYKANGRCFMLDVYNDFPPTLDEWTKMEEIAVDGMLTITGPDSYKSHLYDLLQFPLNRTSLSPVIQQECPGEIMAVVLQETRVQQEAYDYVHSNFGNKDLIMGEVFQPKVKPDPLREKRDAIIRIIEIYEVDCYIIIREIIICRHVMCLPKNTI